LQASKYTANGLLRRLRLRVERAPRTKKLCGAVKSASAKQYARLVFTPALAPLDEKIGILVSASEDI
jgi:hypothetical protein